MAITIIGDGLDMCCGVKTAPSPKQPYIGHQMERKREDGQTVEQELESHHHT